MDWINYAERRPDQESFYEWRMPSVALPSEIVRVKAMNRQRGAGFERVLSPQFDYWDGYRVHVPAGLQWRELSEPVPARIRTCDQYDYEVEGIALCACPFCKRVPSLEFGLQYLGGGESWVTNPHTANRFRLECCGWIRSARYNTPQELAAFWNSRLSPEPRP